MNGGEIIVEYLTREKVPYVFGLCGRCGGRLRLLATILDPRAIRAVLGALAVESETADRARLAPVS